MALTDDLSRLLGYDQGPDNNSEVTFKIKPLGSVNAVSGQSPSDPAATGVGGETAQGVGAISGLAGPGSGSTTPLSAGQVPSGFGPGGQSIVPQAQQQRRTNPTLVTHPLGAQTDDIYEAAVAQLQFDTQSRYAQLLQELGFVDDSGQFMPGTLETDASRQRAELERQREISMEDVVNAAVRGGTVFSGRRATNTARAQQPYDAAIGELTTRLSRELATRYQGIAGLSQQFELGRGMLLAEAAERIKAGLMGGPVGGESRGGAPAPPGGAPVGASGPTLPAGWRVQHDPQRGSIVVDAAGNRMGYIGPDGLFYTDRENASSGGQVIPSRFLGAGGGSRTSLAQ